MKDGVPLALYCSQHTLALMFVALRSENKHTHTHVITWFAALLVLRQGVNSQEQKLKRQTLPKTHRKMLPISRKLHISHRRMCIPHPPHPPCHESLRLYARAKTPVSWRALLFFKSHLTQSATQRSLLLASSVSHLQV